MNHDGGGTASGPAVDDQQIRWRPVRTEKRVESDGAAGAGVVPRGQRQVARLQCRITGGRQKVDRAVVVRQGGNVGIVRDRTCGAAGDGPDRTIGEIDGAGARAVRKGAAGERGAAGVKGSGAPTHYVEQREEAARGGDDGVVYVERRQSGWSDQSGIEG